MTIRHANPDDLPGLITMTEATVRSIHNNDYNSAQIDVWADSVKNYLHWESMIRDQYCLLAVEVEPTISMKALKLLFQSSLKMTSCPCKRSLLRAKAINAILL